MENASSEQQLKSFFEKLYEKELNEAEVAEYKDRIVKFYLVLIEIDQRNKRLKKN